MKYKNRLFLVLCAITLALGLFACNNKANSSKTANPTEANENSKTTPKNEQTDTDLVTKYPASILDSEGSEITIAKEPMKVVSMAPNITELLFKLGLQNKLVGRTTYCDYPIEAQEIQSVGTLKKPDIEKIISLEPDVVIASTHFSEESAKQLIELGVKVIVLYEEYEIEGVYSVIDTLGTIFNVNETAANVINDMKTSIEETRTIISDLKSPSVYYVVGFGEYGDYTAGGDTFISGLITLAGGDNIAKEVSGWSYTLESLVEADPDMIIIGNDMLDSFIQTDIYKDLTAVKTGKVYGIDPNLLERQGYRNAEGIRVLAEIFHPEVFQ